MPVNPILARVREVLAETGKNQRALAAEGLASQQTLSRIATLDAAEPSAGTLANICERLGVNGHWLLTGQGEKRVMAAGGDAVFAAGVEAGIQRAEEAVRALRATSGAEVGARPPMVAEVVERLYRGVREDVASASQPPPPARRRKRSG